MPPGHADGIFRQQIWIALLIVHNAHRNPGFRIDDALGGIKL